MIIVKRTHYEDQDFMELVRLLDADLAERDGQDHKYYSQFNKIDKLKYAVVAYQNEKPLGCGAMKAFDSKTMEIKRMYVCPENRGKGIADKILNDLENWAAELSVEKCILETGKRQPEAIRFYEKNGYQRIPNYGPYIGVENSICFKKETK